MKKHLSFILLILLVCACDSVKDKTKKIIRSTGETVGETVSEFGQGVSEGVNKSLDYEIQLSDSLINSGLKIGNITVSNDSSGTDNKLSVYCIFNADFEGSIFGRILNHTGKETGRTKQSILAKKGETLYLDFIFPVQTNIDRNSKIYLF